jgi:hypothetical protein
MTLAAMSVIWGGGCERYQGFASAFSRIGRRLDSAVAVEGSLSVLADYIGPHKIMWATDYPHSAVSSLGRRRDPRTA